MKKTLLGGCVLMELYEFWVVIKNGNGVVVMSVGFRIHNHGTTQKNKKNLVEVYNHGSQNFAKKFK